MVRLLLFSELDRPSRSLRFRHLCVPLPKDMTKDRADQHDQVETHEPCVQATQIECLVLTRGRLPVGTSIPSHLRAAR